jgi:alpha-galactosidase
MGPRITIIGGGSYQWTPKLLVDFVNTPALSGAEIVLHDIDPAPIPRMVDLARHLASVRGIGLTADGTTDRRAALEGADFVVVNISTGGFASMRHDLEIPQRHGMRQSVGDTVGPGGVLRALRNIPVFLDIAADVEALCPDAWLLNLTNPMTTICRALTRETSLKTVGLCHEITITQFLLSLLLDVSFLDLTVTVGGVNHLPFVTALDVAGADGFMLLRAVLDDAEARSREPLAMAIPDGLDFEKYSEGPDWTKGDVLRNWRVKLELFTRFGVLPGAGDRHLAEFFPNFLTEESGWGARWGIGLTSIEDRERDQDAHVAALDAMLARDDVESLPSGEMVAPVIQCLLHDQPGRFPLNVPNEGQVADLPLGATVESMCIVSGSGIRGRDVVALPAGMAEVLRRVSASQELTVEAAVTGDRDTVFVAMLLDPLTSRLDYDAVATMTDEMLAATSAWLPQFDAVG